MEERVEERVFKINRGSRQFFFARIKNYAGYIATRNAIK